MKKTLTAILIAAALFTAAGAQAQPFGQYAGARTLDVNGHMTGVYFQTSENVLGVLGQLRLCFYPGVDFGFQGGLARQDYGTESRTTVRLGGDFKYAVLSPSEPYPFSVSIGGGLGVEVGDNFSILSVGPMIVGSRTIATGETVSLTPYVAAGVLFSNVNVANRDDSDFSLPLRVGTTMRLTQQVELVGELQFRIGDTFNDNLGFAFGANFPF